jgi:hypothetical protein
MTRRLVLLLALLVGLAVPVSAQFFGVVFDPSNYGNALLRYAELQKQYTQLVTTYQQIQTQYLLLLQQTQRLPVDMHARYRTLPSAWLPFTAANAYGLTTGWIAAARTGLAASAGYTRATQPLIPYGGAIRQLSADEAARVKARVDRLQLADASVVHGLEALGVVRSREASVETAIRNLEIDTYASSSAFNTQIAVLNKINATAVTAARLAKDTNHLLVSLLEQQLLEMTERREAAVQGINAHIAFETDARSLLSATTSQTTTALTTFRIP